MVRRVAPTGPDTRLLRGGCVFDSSTRPTRGSPPVAPTKFDSSDDASRRIGPDSCDSSDSAGRVARRVRPAARLVRPRSCRLGPDSCDSSDSSGVSRDASGQRPDSSDHGRVGSGPTRATPQTPRACRTTRRASGPTRPTRVVSARPRARLVRLVRLLGLDFFFSFFLVPECFNCIRSTCWTTAKGNGSFQRCHESSLQRRPGCKDAPPPPLPLRPRALRACRCAPDHPTSESRSSRSVAATRASARRWRCRVHRSMAKVGVQPRALFESDELLVVRMRQLLADSVAQPHERARRMPTTT